METATQQAHGNAQVILNQNNPGQASADSTAQTGRAGAGDWQDEIYQMIKCLKDQYFAQLSELFNKISLNLQQVDSIIPRQSPSEQYERMKNFKIMLDRILQLLQISRSTIQPALREKVPKYEKQIISILNAQRRKPVQAQVQQQLLQVQMNHYKASADSTAQTGYAGAGDWQEEIYQMIKTLKDQYFAELSDLSNRISVKLQQVDSIIPRQRSSEQYGRMKTFKILLDRILQVLQISRSTILPAMRDKVPKYEKQIISILNAQKRKPVQQRIQQQFQPPAGQASYSYISQQQQPYQSLQQHDSHSKRQASLSSMSTGLQSSSAAVFRHVPAPPTTNFSVYTQQNGADIRQQAAFNLEAVQGSDFNSWQYGLMGGVLREGSTWPMQGTTNAQLQTSMLSHNSVSTTQPGANSMQANERGWTHLSGPRKHAPKRSWCDTF
ncbi:unnamed protein product [Alopecurus aequalis]